MWSPTTSLFMYRVTGVLVSSLSRSPVLSFPLCEFSPYVLHLIDSYRRRIVTISQDVTILYLPVCSRWSTCSCTTHDRDIGSSSRSGSGQWRQWSFASNVEFVRVRKGRSRIGTMAKWSSVIVSLSSRMDRSVWTGPGLEEEKCFA